MSKQSIDADTEGLCGALSSEGFEFHWEADNRGGKSSRYFFIRRPIVAKVRISDHVSDRTQKEQKNSRTLCLDVGSHSITWQQAMRRLRESAHPNKTER
ncbi:MAG: hypothetical protein KGL39_04860 [Patescibacteria group bacterium]|nr:hypothetical protein [Patescibacteria group bacterium]